MAKLVAASDEQWEDPTYLWDEAEAKDRLLNRATGRVRAPKEERANSLLWRYFPHFSFGPRFVPNRLLVTAALVLVSLLMGYQFGIKKDAGRKETASVPRDDFAARNDLARVQAERQSLSDQLAASVKTIADLRERSSRQETRLVQIENLKLSLQGQMQQLSSENQLKSNTVQSLSVQRDALQRQLEDADQSLRNVRNDLVRTQDERQGALLKAASLETRIDELSSDLRESSASVQRQKGFLASDRDIRELMGARQLYIADVFDVDHNGRKRKTFGRVFYTKGKSLIFYAFDLDQQPGYRDAKAVQVWGSPSEDQSNAVNLGIFYLDSEANRRWVFKSDDPVTLENINAVFVTIERKGTNTKPTGKPFLYAYLRTAPANHP
ncbi:MAG: hypothetical protein LAO30_23520 [Acidobacteriia bacterium]|nr:hypothetical protein [Terriglobia bacterium]